VKLGQLIQLRPPSISELSDEGLAAACATGDRAAQALLYERHADAVFRFISRARGPDIEDLVHATFLAAFKSAGTFRGPKLQSWLFGIACNVMRTYVRKEIARRRIATTLADQPTETATPRDADVARLRAAIDALPAKHRDVILLIDLQGEKGCDAAQALGLPEGTVWRRLSEARAKLRALLEAP
jgi:RNA polymerase sigma-70 factor (ECF subfamily)